MCGIAGVYYKAGGCSGTRWVERMADVLRHRGPDDDGFYHDERIELGFRRLSIIDVEGGHQPIFNEDRTKVIIFNGEVYNYRELRPDLEAAGHVFRTFTDTEVVLHAYEQYGQEFLQRLNGMFAFAIWDSRAGRLLLARDRLGVKPLYYVDSPSHLAFASELKALLALRESPGIDSQAIHDFLTLRYVPAPESAFVDVKKLLPGYVLEADGGAAVARKYWDVAYVPKRRGSRRTLQGEFWRIFVDSVSLRLRSDVPLGVFLSGGLDSSAVVAAMSELGIKDIRTFSIGFDVGPAYQEFEHAARVADLYGTDHHATTIGFDAFFRALPRVVWHLDEPVADSATIPLYIVSELAKQHVTVILSGEGSDEVLAGYTRSYYPYYRWQQVKSVLRRLPAFCWGRNAVRIASAVSDRLGRAVRFVGRPVSDDDLFPMSLTMSEDEKRTLYGRFGGPDGLTATVDKMRKIHEPLDGGYLDKRLYLDLRSWLPDDLLAKADRATMAHGLELRVPFLDYRLVEFTARLRDSLKVRRGVGKYLLRRALQGRLPEEILTRKKMGFPVPIQEWFAVGGPARRVARRVILSDRARERSLFDPDSVARVLDGPSCVYVWYLLVLELWFRMFVDGERPDDVRLVG